MQKRCFEVAKVFERRGKHDGFQELIYHCTELLFDP